MFFLTVSNSHQQDSNESMGRGFSISKKVGDVLNKTTKLLRIIPKGQFSVRNVNMGPWSKASKHFPVNDGFAEQVARSNISIPERDLFNFNFFKKTFS